MRRRQSTLIVILLALFALITIASTQTSAQENETPETTRTKDAISADQLKRSEATRRAEKRRVEERKERIATKEAEKSGEYDLAKRHPNGFIALMIVVIIGGFFAVWGQIMFLIATFRTSIIWGLAYLFFPMSGLVYLCLHWNQARRPLSTMLTGAAVLLFAFLTALGIQHFIDHA